MDRSIIKVFVAAITAAIVTAVAGCSAGSEPPNAQTANITEHNRLLVRMALAENVYNAVAAERAVYPKDFLPGTATLSELGSRRIDTLVHASRGASGRINIIRGNESQPLHDARIAAVRQHLTDTGVNLERVAVTSADHVDAAGISSAEAILIFDRMISEYVAKRGGGPADAAAGTGTSGGMQGPSTGSDRSGNPNNR